MLDQIYTFTKVMNIKYSNYSIKPKVIFLINIEDDNIYIKLQDINIKNLPNIFKTLSLDIEVNIFPRRQFL